MSLHLEIFFFRGTFHNMFQTQTRRIYRDGELIYLNWFTANLPTKKCPQLQKAKWSDNG